MTSNRMKLNTGKNQFTCLGTSHQLTKVDASIFVVNGVAVDLLHSVTCLGVSIDQELTFADHIRSLASSHVAASFGLGSYVQTDEL